MVTIKVKTDLADVKLIPKIIWGIDDAGFIFIHFKMKDVGKNQYLKSIFNIIYQDQRKCSDPNKALNRMNDVIDYIKTNYKTTPIRKFGSRNHLFIKGKIFYKYDLIVKFYNNLILNMIVKIGNHINPKVINNAKANVDYSNDIGILNYED